MSDDSESILVQLARIEGAINLTNQKLDTLSANVVDLKGEVDKHDKRIDALETQSYGAALVVKVLWMLGGGGIGGAALYIAQQINQ